MQSYCAFGSPSILAATKLQCGSKTHLPFPRILTSLLRKRRRRMKLSQVRGKDVMSILG